MRTKTTTPYTPPHSARPLVLFDGACPLCRREISHYRRLAGAESIDWFDLADPNMEIPDNGITRETAMARMHVRDRNGKWHTGAWAFAELWSHLNHYRHLSRLARISRLLPLADRAYSHFAKWRVQRRCDEHRCQSTFQPSDSPADRTRS